MCLFLCRGGWEAVLSSLRNGTEALASPQAEKSSAINLPDKLGKFRQPNV